MAGEDAQVGASPPIKLCEKRQAILQQQGHILVLGGPGSGKTTIALLKAKEACGTLLPGQQVLFLSFSRAAVRQVLSRCTQLLSVRERSLIDVRTYHAFGIDLLRSHGALLNGKPARVLAPDDESLLKFENGKGWANESQRLARDEGRYCFDMFAPFVAEVLERAACVRELLAAKYPLVVIDEFQDTDDDQWRMVQQLARHTVVFCLADPDQRIFEYRGNVSPLRMAQLRTALKPAEFDFTTDNHRSPGSGILAFADAVYRNGPRPATNDVKELSYHPGGLPTLVHAAVVWTISQIAREHGIARPRVAILCRTNGLVAQVSTALREKHTFKEREFGPVPHDVLWDPELVAASARVVASILEWPDVSPHAGVARTLALMAHYYRLKNAARASEGAAASVIKLSAASDAVAAGQKTKFKVAAQLLAAAPAMAFSGDPVADWLRARGTLNEVNAVADVLKEARLVRLFGAGDALAAGLHDLWLSSASYSGATSMVKRVLDRERIVGSEQELHACVLMNMHKSKGKEFDGVVIVEGEYTGGFFSDREDPAQSRRLLRVAITRARHMVLLVRPRGAQSLCSA